jgi:hypothetical protein
MGDLFDPRPAWGARAGSAPATLWRPCCSWPAQAMARRLSCLAGAAGACLRTDKPRDPPVHVPDMDMGLYPISPGGQTRSEARVGDAPMNELRTARRAALSAGDVCATRSRSTRRTYWRFGTTSQRT